MTFDTIIIGGGLSGLICGIRLQRAGKRCAVVSAGQNAMHFFSGGFGLLSRMPDGTEVRCPLDAVDSLPEEHPYRKIGKDRISAFDPQAKELFRSCGINVSGSAERNSFIVSAMGGTKPVWLAAADMAILEGKDEKVGDNVLIVNIEGFLDFNAVFVAEGLERNGSRCRIATVTTDEIRRLRKNPTEMRSSNIAKIMSCPEALNSLIRKIREQVKDEDCIVLPAVFGLTGPEEMEQVRAELGRKTVFVGTLPPSVPGIRSQMLLKKAYEVAGGVFLKGDRVVGAEIQEGKVLSVSTANLEDEKLYAENFVLAAGSFFGHGLMSGPDKVYEPVFGLDVIADEDRNLWYDKDFFSRQNFIGYGVRTDGDFRVCKDGKTMENLYAAGSVLGGCNPLYEGCGAGVAIMTALYVSDIISGGDADGANSKSNDQ